MNHRPSDDLVARQPLRALATDMAHHEFPFPNIRPPDSAWKPLCVVFPPVPLLEPGVVGGFDEGGQGVEVGRARLAHDHMDAGQ